MMVFTLKPTIVFVRPDGTRITRPFVIALKA